MNETFYVTTPIYYVNAKPHLGHLYTTIVADALARHHRQRGTDSYFLTGTDEHGQNIERAAAALDKPVREHVDGIVREFQETFAEFGLKSDQWIRTTSDAHIQGARELWKRVAANGFIYKDAYHGWYCPNCNEFKDETTPGQAPICDVHLRETERVSEESYFFKLSAFRERLLEFYENYQQEHGEQFVQPPSRQREVWSFVYRELKDISISRVSVKWGIPVPGDDAHTMYVWFDALSNYITALGFGSNDESKLEKYWPNSLHLVGKDILRFHAVYWPAFLMAAGLKPPHRVFAHGMWLSQGRKMSKTPGPDGKSNSIDLNILRKYFTPEQVRYFCLREMPYGEDGDFTYESLIDRVNGDLASGLGNLASRILTMIKNYFDGSIPEPPEVSFESHGWQDLEKEVSNFQMLVVTDFENRAKNVDSGFREFQFNYSVSEIWNLIAKADKYLSDKAPWKLAKKEEDREVLKAVLGYAIRMLRFITVLVYPTLPETAEALWKQMGLPDSPANVNPDTLKLEDFPNNIQIGEVKGLFPRLEKEKIMKEIEAIETAAAAANPAPVAPAPEAAPAAAPVPEITEEKTFITIDDFVKVELRVAQVLEAERVPKADKLLRLQVDAGEGQPRQILAGIAQYYEPEALINRKIVIVANLAPRKLRGFESNGMLLAASIGEEGRPVLASFLEDVPNGARLK